MSYRRLLLLSAIAIMSLLSRAYADIATLTNTGGKDYNSLGLSYSHMFNDQADISLNYSSDTQRAEYNSGSIDLTCHIDSSSYFMFEVYKDYSKSVSITDGVDIHYGKTFLDASDEAQDLVPRILLGVGKETIDLIASKKNFEGHNYVLGGGLDVFNIIDVDVTWTSYGYPEASKIKNSGRPKTVKTLLLNNLASSPISSVDGTLTYYLNDVISLYYSGNTTKDLLEEISGSVTYGISWQAFDQLSFGLSVENAEDLAYSTLSASCLF